MNSNQEGKLPPNDTMTPTMVKLEATFGTEHPEYRRSDHQREVDCGDTRLWAYWEWVIHQIESNGGSVDKVIAETERLPALDPRALPRELHKRLFARYLANLRLADAEEIFRAIERCWHEQLNGNMGSQLKAHNKQLQAVGAAVEHMLAHDLSAIDSILAAAAKPSAPALGR